MTTTAADSVSPGERIVLLDSLRGFGVLGILLMNILAFGMLSPAYSYPGFDLGLDSGINLWAWVIVDIFGEGSMRGMFSLLFGAGVVLFTSGDRAKSAALHYRRMFFLLLFGLFDAYVLLWFGDILVCYALCGAMLYPLRNWRPGSLIILATLIAALCSLSYYAMAFVLNEAQLAARELASAADPAQLDPRITEAAEAWHGFVAEIIPGAQDLEQERAMRAGSYVSAFRWNAAHTNVMLLFLVPAFILWDSLFMMLLGMALFKLGLLGGRMQRSTARRLAVIGLGCGVLVNVLEVRGILTSAFDLLSAFAFASWSYHLGRVAMTLGYLGLLAWIMQSNWLDALMRRLAAVGRMALSNYLMHSLIAMLLFSGAGLGLIGQLERAQLYLVVAAIWAWQLWFSPWWLARYRYGPLEYVWRTLTYGHRPR